MNLTRLQHAFGMGPLAARQRYVSPSTLCTLAGSPHTEFARELVAGAARRSRLVCGPTRQPRRRPEPGGRDLRRRGRSARRVSAGHWPIRDRLNGVHDWRYASATLPMAIRQAWASSGSKRFVTPMPSATRRGMAPRVTVCGLAATAQCGTTGWLRCTGGALAGTPRARPSPSLLKGHSNELEWFRRSVSSHYEQQRTVLTSLIHEMMRLGGLTVGPTWPDDGDF